MVISYREQQKNATLERYKGEHRVERLWNKHIGSRRIFMSQELQALRKLEKEDVLNHRDVYSLYLTSKHWKMMRAKVFKRDNRKCQQCGIEEQSMHVDHIQYTEFGKEEMDDLQTLCFNCHQMKSKYDLRL